MEHRCGYRRDIQVKVRVSTRGGLSGYGRLIEASGSGARLVTQLPIPIHSVVILTFDEMRNPDSKRLRLEAEVVRVTTDGYGIEWTQFAPTGLRTLYQDFASKADRGGASTAVQP